MIECTTHDPSSRAVVQQRRKILLVILPVHLPSPALASRRAAEKRLRERRIIVPSGSNSQAGGATRPVPPEPGHVGV